MVYTGIRTRVIEHHSQHRCRYATVTPSALTSPYFKLPFADKISKSAIFNFSIFLKNCENLQVFCKVLSKDLSKLGLGLKNRPLQLILQLKLQKINLSAIYYISCFQYFQIYSKKIEGFNFKFLKSLENGPFR
jgi:hypothetical protein